MHFLGFVNDSGSGVCGEREGLVWLGLVEKCGYSEILWGSPCFLPWLPLGILHFEFLGVSAGSRGEWGEVERCLI